MSDRLTILFMPESAYGPTNNCIGIGKVLERRGHRVVFAAEASWKGRLEPLGFEEDLVDLAPPPEDGAEQDAGQFWTDFVIETAPEFRKPTIEQLATFVEPVWASLIDGAVFCEPQLRAILDRAQPDVIVEDNVNAFPALLTHGAPWVRIVSLQPARDEGSGPSADLLRATRRATRARGTSSARSTSGPTARPGSASTRSCSTAARRRFPTSSSSTSPSD